MSRTYRCRHLPKVARRRWCGRWAANKVVDGGGGWRRYYREIEAETTRFIGYPEPSWKERYGYTKTGTHTEVEILPMPFGWDKKIWNQKDIWGFPKRWEDQSEAKVHHIRRGVERLTQDAFEWRRVHDFVESNHVREVAHWHPYARKRALGRGKFGEWRRRANREMRRRTRQVAHSGDWADEDFDYDWPEEDLYLDRWMFY